METTEKNLDYYRKNAKENYLTTPISVLRYISEMEAALRKHDVAGRSEQLPRNLCTLNQNTCVKGSGCKYPHCLFNGNEA